MDDRKSTSSFVFICNGGVVSWKSSKQEITGDSTMEDKYVAACDVAKEAVWIRKLIVKLEMILSIELLISLYCDNNGAIAQAREPKSHYKSKHIKHRFHLIQEI